MECGTDFMQSSSARASRKLSWGMFSLLFPTSNVEKMVLVDRMVESRGMVGVSLLRKPDHPTSSNASCI